MKVPFVDLKAQYFSIKEEIDSAILDVLANTAFILGKAVGDFEQEFAKTHNVKFCYGVSSGTDGNHLALWALNIKQGDEVIIPVNTFIATAWGATLCRAKPVFVDCEEDSYNIDPGKVEAKITPRTKAIVVVHLYGQPADMDPLREIAKKHNIVLVEDCAQAHLAEYKGKKVGGLSRAASFSFYPGKNLGAYGEGGAVVTDDPELASKFKMMRDHGTSTKYYHDSEGHNYRMEGIQGAVLGVKMRYINKWTEARRQHALAYTSLLKDADGIVTPREMAYAKHVYHLYVIRTKNRDKLQKHLDGKGIATGLHYPVPLHLQKVFKDLGYHKGDFPIAERVAEEMLSLPMYPELTDEQIHYVCDAIKELVG
jgi:dTDP-4-amino-4,6-dideoxygalactose transaminase